MKYTRLPTIVSVLALLCSVAQAGPTQKTKPATAKSATAKAAAPARPRTDLVTTQSGRAPASKLKMKSSKVPAFEIYQKRKVNGKIETYRVKSIPRLDVGAEPSIAANSNSAAIVLPAARTPANITVQRLPSPPPVDVQSYLKDRKFEVAGEPRQVFTVDPQYKAPAAIALAPQEKLNLAAEPAAPELGKIHDLGPNQLKMLQALIFLEIQKSYNIALALFAELINEKEIATEATYQLAVASKGLGLNSEYKHQMTRVLTEGSPEWQKKAISSLAEDAQAGDLQLVGLLDPKAEALKLDLSEQKLDQYQMNRAKYYLEKGNLTAANAAMENISEASPLALDAQFLKSVILYKGGQLQEAIGLQTRVLETLMLKSPDSELRSVSALTLARMHFQASQYKMAYDTYLKVNKESPEFTQAMIEQSWSQILAEDYEGAAGNMFSLHTSFFKNAFAPESYVVRTVGYLNLCQYGDGARVINDFKKRYTSVQKQMSDYDQKTSGSGYYDTVKTYFRSREAKLIDGLPRNFVYELARHPTFINEQKSINAVEDQISRYNRITLDLIKKEREIVRSQSDVRTKVIEIKGKLARAAAAGEKASLKDALTFQDKRLLSYRIQSHIAKRARNSIKELRINGLARIEKEKEAFKQKANSILKGRFQAMLTTLKNTLDQAEVLNYELYSGAGEHIRYQLAGGDLSEAERAELKPEDGKSMKWDFQGEVWEDELGHYRSGLKNVCPREGLSQTDIVK